MVQLEGDPEQAASRTAMDAKDCAEVSAPPHGPGRASGLRLMTSIDKTAACRSLPSGSAFPQAHPPAPTSRRQGSAPRGGASSSANPPPVKAEGLPKRNISRVTKIARRSEAGGLNHLQNLVQDHVGSAAQNDDSSSEDAHQQAQQQGRLDRGRLCRWVGDEGALKNPQVVVE